MKSTVLLVVAGILAAPLGAQEQKPVPKDSVRVSVAGCSKGYVFTTGPRTEDRPGGSGIPEGMHLRMNGQKKLMAEIKGQEGSMIEITGLVKKGQIDPRGVGVGGGVQIAGGPSPTGGGMRSNPGISQAMIDVEGWRSVAGNCPSR